MLINVLTALLVVAAIGFIAGVLLAVAYHFFKVEENETVKSVRGCLPGANCGACGFAGCDSYAEAVADGKAEPNLCIPGGADVAQQLAGILGVEVTADEPKVAFVACNGDCEAAKYSAIYDGMKSCKAAVSIFGGPYDCRFSCLGCGDCASVCPADAIDVYDGLAHIDPKACIGCGKCVNTCPKFIIKLVPKDAVIAVACNNADKGAVARKNCEHACIGCKKCEKTCPNGAISVLNNFAIVDYDKCSKCGACVEQCPVGCLKSVDFVNGRIG